MGLGFLTSATGIETAWRKRRGDNTERKSEQLERRVTNLSNTTVSSVIGIAVGNGEVMDKVLEMKERLSQSV